LAAVSNQLRLPFIERECKGKRLFAISKILENFFQKFLLLFAFQYCALFIKASAKVKRFFKLPNFFASFLNFLFAFGVCMPFHLRPSF
jgi:hypothetical protein